MARARSSNVAAKYQASWEKFKQQSKGSSDNTVSEDRQLKAVSVSNNSPTDTSNSRRVSFHGVKDSNSATFKSKQESQTKHPKLVEKKQPWKNLQKIEIVPPLIVPQQQQQQQSQQLPTHSNTNKTITRRRPRSANTNITTSSNTNTTTTATITKMETPSSNNVSVVVRLRPIVPHESKRGATKVVHKVRTIDAVLQKKKEDEEVVRVELAPNLSPKAASNNRELVKCFALDGVLEEHDTQTDVYKKSGAFKAVTQDLFRGFHCTILAYGQSGSGKTYTMGTMAAADLSSTGKGSEALDEQAGVIQRACHDLFQQVEQQCMGDATVELSYLEIYNEEVRDLLSTKTSKLTHSAVARLQKERERLQQQEGLPLSSMSSNGLQIREDPNGEVFVQGKTSVAVTNATQVIELMRLANAKRVVASTKLNDVSSRSHAICILTVTGTNSYDVTFQSRLTLVDLAGSERLSKTENTGMRIKEGININVGLFVLGLVISALTETRPAHKRHPPYRESKLTRILQNSLGGNARTIMIACISPTDYHAEETCNTLRYATQARNIENPAIANVIHDEHAEQVLQLQSENDHLLKNNLSLQEQLAQYESLIKQMSSELNHVKQHYETTTMELREVKQDYQTTAEQLMEIQEDFKLTVEQLHRQKIEDVIKNKRQRQKKLSCGQYLYSVYNGDDEDLLTDANNTPTRSISSAFNSIGTEPTADLTIGTNAMSPNRLVPPPHLQSEEDKSISRLDEEEEEDESVPVSQVAEDSCDQSQAISLLTEHQEWNSTVENNPLLGEMKDDDEDVSISKVMEQAQESQDLDDQARELSEQLEQEDEEEGSLHSLTTEIHEPFSTNYQPQDDEEEEKKDETCDSSYQKCKTSAASKLNCNDSLVDKESEVMVEAVPVSMPYNDLAGVKMPISPKSTASLTKEDNSLTSGTITQGSQATKNSNSKKSALKRFMSKMNCMSGVYGVVQNNSCTNPNQSAQVERV